MRRYILIIAIILSISNYSKGQFTDFENMVPANAVPPTPESATLGQYGNIDVSNFTGKPNLNIPLYTISGKTFSLPINMIYGFNPIKIGQPTGMVGTNWMLNAAGVINRTINGITDFKPIEHRDINAGTDYGGFGTSTKKIPVDLMFSDGGGTISGGIRYSDGTQNNSWYDAVTLLSRVLIRQNKDTEPDMFSYNFLNNGGQFFFDNNAKIKFSKPEQLEFAEIPKKDIDNWIVYDFNGNKYTFSNKEYSTSIDMQNGHNMKTTSSWYLSKVESPTGESLIFSYKPYLTKLATYDQEEIACDENTWPNSGYGHFTLPRPHIEINGLYLEKIEYYSNSILLQSVIFGIEEYIWQENVQGNVDGLKLNYIKIFKNNETQPFLTYNFEYDGLSTNYLCLKKIRKFGENNNEIPFYSFEYNNHSQLPKISNAIDYWGNYNGKNDNMGIIPLVCYDFYGSKHYPDNYFYRFLGNRMPDAIYMKYGLLTKVNYPTGGSTLFEYEPHTFNNFTFQDSINFMVQNDSKSFYLSKTTDVTINATINKTYNYNLEKTLIVNPNNNITSAEYLKYCTSPNSSLRIVGTFTNTQPATDRCIVYDPDGNVVFEKRSNFDEEIPIPKIGFYKFRAECGSGNCNIKFEIFTKSGPFTNYYPVLKYPDNTEIKFENTGIYPLNLPKGEYTCSIKYENHNAPTSNASMNVNYAENKNYGSGIRISKITDIPVTGEPVSRFFEYLQEDSTSSGWLSMHPVNHMQKFYERAGFDGYYVRDHYSSNVIFENCEVTYTDVLIITPGNGKSCFKYKLGLPISNDYIVESLFSVNAYLFFSDFDPKLAGLQGVPLTDYPEIKGDLIKESIYDETGNLLKDIEYKYHNPVEYNSYGFRVISLTGPSAEEIGEGYNPSNHLPLADALYSSYKRKLGYELLKEKIITDYDSAGHTIVKTETFSYNSLSQLISKKVIDNYNEINSLYKYPIDLMYLSSGTNIYNNMYDKYLRASVIQEFVDINRGNQVRGLFKQFELLGNNYYPTKQYILDSKILSSSSPTEIPSAYFGRDPVGCEANKYGFRLFSNLRYSELGNLLQYNKKDDIITTYYYGYNKQYPVAKITGNLTYDQIVSAAGAELDKLDDENVNLNQVNTNIRNLLSGCMVLTYTYKPMVGILTETDANGKTNFYEYDDFGRLVRIRDNNQKIIKELKYNYKGQAQ